MEQVLQSDPGRVLAFLQHNISECGCPAPADLFDARAIFSMRGFGDDSRRADARSSRFRTAA